MKKIFLVFSVFCFMLQACGPNALVGLGSETSDEYFIEEAKKANNAQDYNLALDILLNKISVSAQASVSVKELLASSYAGKCGFNFVNYVTSLSSASGTAVFNTMMQPFVGITTKPEYCLASLQTLDSLGSPGNRTVNQNFFSAVTGLVLMGASIRAYADKDGTNQNGNGLMDSAGMICNSTLVTDDQMNDMIVGYGYFVTNLAYVTADTLGSTSFNSLNQSVTICNSLGGNCTITNKNSVTAQTRLAIRKLLNTSEYGIGNAPSVASPCP